jgi:transcriptional regulator with XRE-family HTH domain
MTSLQIFLSPSRRTATRFIGAVRRALQKALVEEAKKSGLTQAEVARRIGVNRSIINRELRGVENLSLGRVAELAWAMGRTPSFELRERIAASGSNEPAHDRSGAPFENFSVQSSEAANINSSMTQETQRAVDG